MSNKSDRAVQKFLSGYNCAQSVFYAFCEDLGIYKDNALKLACGFGAGMGRMQEVCGAVSGAILAIGARYGRGEKDEIASTENTYIKTREFMNAFKEKHRSYICKQLLNGCELLEEEGHKYFKDNDLRNKVCVPCVRNAVEILEGII